MTSEKMDVSAGIPGAAVTPRPDAARARASLASPPSLGRPRQSGQASLEAELARERHVALELQRAILPLHDEPFGLPGLRAVVRVPV